MKNSKIGWTDNTFNPWIGCKKVSPGCANCYAEALMDKRMKRVEWGGPRSLTSESYWRQPITWDRKAHQSGQRLRVFCGSLCDWLDEDVPISWLAKLLNLIVDTPMLHWQLLTKRPENWRPRLEAIAGEVAPAGRAPAYYAQRWLDGNLERLDHLWIGTSVETQALADKRIPALLSIPATLRFLSCEPLLGSVDLRRIHHDGTNRIHWVIAGGESGVAARTCDIEWFESLAEQCAAADITFFMKQMGSYPLGLQLKSPKGDNPKEWPENLRIQQFPGRSNH